MNIVGEERNTRATDTSVQRENQATGADLSTIKREFDNSQNRMQLENMSNNTYKRVSIISNLDHPKSMVSQHNPQSSQNSQINFSALKVLTGTVEREERKSYADKNDDKKMPYHDEDAYEKVT